MYFCLREQQVWDGHLNGPRLVRHQVLRAGTLYPWDPGGRDECACCPRGGQGGHGVRSTAGAHCDGNGYLPLPRPLHVRSWRNIPHEGRGERGEEGTRSGGSRQEMAFGYGVGGTRRDQGDRASAEAGGRAGGQGSRRCGSTTCLRTDERCLFRCIWPSSTLQFVEYMDPRTSMSLGANISVQPRQSSSIVYVERQMVFGGMERTHECAGNFIVVALPRTFSFFPRFPAPCEVVMVTHHQVHHFEILLLVIVSKSSQLPRHR
mmetsp:Transcript_13625/g.33992  ORF Transcript_13625/g.33992 Transcript_13625/m.33992 type:complete len:262 (-) Transcript_13625:43-828(-)